LGGGAASAGAAKQARVPAKARPGHDLCVLLSLRASLLCCRALLLVERLRGRALQRLGLEVRDGLFAVLHRFVSGRTREIAIRMALGADRGWVRRLVLSQGLGATALGIGLVVFRVRARAEGDESSSRRSVSR
jgi:hypothetical protein